MNFPQGDVLQLQCFYRTSQLNTSQVILVSTFIYFIKLYIMELTIISCCIYTQGGESTREEMCIAFLAYYPQLRVGACGSLPRIPDAFAPFASQHVK